MPRSRPTELAGEASGGGGYSTVNTVFILKSIHRPSDDEADTCLRALIAEGKRQGFEPFAARAVGHDLAEAGSQQHDPEIMDKWFREHEARQSEDR